MLGMDITLLPATVLGTVSVPSSKSQTIRALLLSSFSRSHCLIKNPLLSRDTQSCIDVCKALGARLKVSDSLIEVDSADLGKGLEEVTLDCGNSATTMLLATPLVASLGIRATFTGDESLLSRPVGPLLRALSALGAKVEAKDPELPPYTIEGPLKGGKATIFCKTSQYLSGLLMGCPLAQGACILDVPLLYEKPYVRITEDYLKAFGAVYSRQSDLQRFEIPGSQAFKAADIRINGDFSSASFFFCAAAITGSRVTVKGLDSHDPQGDKGILRILTAMGCKVSWKADQVTVSAGPRLLGGTFDLNAMPDTLPALAVTACYASEPVNLINVPQARLKETDRIAVMQKALSSMGASISELNDGLAIRPAGPLSGGRVNSLKDHRIAMAFAIASLRCKTDLTIEDAQVVDITYPSFFKTLESIKEVHNADN